MTQHKTARVQHDTTQDNTGATRDNTSATRDNTSITRGNRSTKQHKIYFDLFISSLYIRRLAYDALNHFLYCKP